MHCGRCHSVVYCGVPCQRAAWPSHKRACAPPVAGPGAGAREPPVVVEATHVPVSAPDPTVIDVHDFLGIARPEIGAHGPHDMPAALRRKTLSMGAPVPARGFALGQHSHCMLLVTPWSKGLFVSVLSVKGPGVSEEVYVPRIAYNVVDQPRVTRVPSALEFYGAVMIPGTQELLTQLEGVGAIHLVDTAPEKAVVLYESLARGDGYFTLPLYRVSSPFCQSADAGLRAVLKTAAP